MIRRYEVIRVRRSPDAVDATDVRADFDLRETGVEPPASVFDDPAVSLYSLDLKNARAVFVEAADAKALAREPFFYMAQSRRARHVLTVDFGTFFRLYAPSSVHPEKLLHLYSVGRCGSTLLHHALNSVDGVVCYSEPDVLYQLALWRKSGRIGREEAVRLAGASLGCLWRHRPAGCETLAIKHRGKSIWAFREFWDAVPGARSVFLYRNAVDTIQSFDRVSNYAHGRRQWLLETPVLSGVMRAWNHFNAGRWDVDIYREHLSGGTPTEVVVQCGVAGRLLLDWISKLDCYLKLRELDAHCVALRYEDMIAAPQAALSELFSACGLPAAEFQRVIAVFAKDSQEGTALRRAGSKGPRLSETTVRNIQSIIRRQTRLPADMILPGTLAVNASAGTPAAG